MFSYDICFKKAQKFRKYAIFWLQTLKVIISASSHLFKTGTKIFENSAFFHQILSKIVSICFLRCNMMFSYDFCFKNAQTFRKYAISWLQTLKAIISASSHLFKKVTKFFKNSAFFHQILWYLLQKSSKISKICHFLTANFKGHYLSF